jgi:hypothetical protein
MRPQRRLLGVVVALWVEGNGTTFSSSEASSEASRYSARAITGQHTMSLCDSPGRICRSRLKKMTTAANSFPDLAVEVAVFDGSGGMLDDDSLGAAQVGDSPRHLEDTIMAPGADGGRGFLRRCRDQIALLHRRHVQMPTQLRACQPLRRA